MRDAERDVSYMYRESWRVRVRERQREKAGESWREKERDTIDVSREKAGE